MKIKKAFFFCLSALLFLSASIIACSIFNDFSVLGLAGLASTCSHQGNHYIAKEATCEKNGSKEYWICCGCHSIFFPEDVSEIQNGVWTDTNVSGEFGIGGLANAAFVPALGHDWAFNLLDEEHHNRICLRCGKIDDEIHECSSKVYNPSGLARGHKAYECNDCDNLFYTDFDFSAYHGVKFSNEDLRFVPYSFKNQNYTINASVNLPKSISGRAGVILGSFNNSSNNDSINLEIVSSGRIRVYFTSGGTAHDIIFEHDIRRDNVVVTITITIESNKSINLYLDGKFIESKKMNFGTPIVGEHFVVGGDLRPNNSMYFKGTLYALSIFNEVRNQSEIFKDIVLADDTNPNCCASYNLIDESYFLIDFSDLNRLDYVSISSLNELCYHSSIGTKVIEITENIIINRPIYVYGDVQIIAKKDIVLTRDSNYGGDLFVVGTNHRNENPIRKGFSPTLSIGGGNGESSSIMIDGNASNMNVDVYGSAIFAINQSTINFYDGDRIINCFKKGNLRTKDTNLTTPNRIGGAAVVLKQSVFCMHGGIIDNCSVNIKNIGGNSSSSDYMVSTLGGAIYVTGEFYMNGGTISNCSGYYGGAIYQRGIIRIKKGEIIGNTAYDGAGIHSSGSSGSETYIGPAENGQETYQVRFADNVASYRGGAITSSIQSPIVIRYAEFLNNQATKNCGGAIYTSGPLTIQSSKIDNNYAGYAGGAIYHYLSSTEYKTHYLTVENSIVSNNVAMNKGAGVSLGASSSIEDEGTIASFIGCVFDGNYSKSVTTETVDESDPNNPIVTTSTTGGSGGALYSTGHSTLSVDECVFKNNKADNMGACLNSTDGSVISIANSSFDSNWAKSYGGGLSLYGGTKATLKNLDFTNNESDSNAGALYLSGITTSLDNVNFSNNSGSNGGAIYVTGNSNLTITKADFSENEASGYGGAIYLKNANLTINDTDLNSVVFDENVASSGGGAIAALGEGQININGGLFKNNSAGTAGGAIYLNCKGTHTFVNSTFINNYSTSNGGAIWIYRGITASISSCNFIDNSGKNGGALYVDSGSNVTIDNSIFEGNNAFGLEKDENGNGGAIAIYGANTTTVNISNSDFTNNLANVAGGAIYNKNARLYISGITNFDSNTAVSHGGAIVVGNSPRFEITGTASFTNNIAQNSTGGAIYITKVTGEVKIEGAVFYDNSSKTFGGAIYLHTSELTLDGCTFGKSKHGNKTNGNGGAIYVSTYGVLNIKDSSFNYNSAKNGGAISLNNGYSINIENSSFIGNSSTGNGGAICLNDNVTATVSDTEFSYNTSTCGGAIYGISSFVDIHDTSFISNESTNNGGAVTLINGECNISNSYFTMNNAETTGGALDLSCGNITIYNSQFIGNSSSGNGGAIRIDGNGLEEKGILNISSSLFEGNTGRNGGAIFADKYTYVTCDNSTQFIDNIASTSGGAIYINNRCTGALLDDCVFEGNSSTDNGGAFCIKAFSDATISFDNTSFVNNISQANGGALYIGSGCNVLFDHIVATGNNANYGGFAYVTSSGTTVTLKEIVANNNTAKKGNSGFIIVNNSAATIKTNKEYITYNNNESEWELTSIIVGTGNIDEIGVE